MLDKDAIHSLDTNTDKAIEAASRALLVDGKAENLAALPDHFTVHDLEKYLPSRRRARGKMETQVINDFAEYVITHKEPGASVFIDVDAMKAVGVLNLGTTEAPGHADDKATFTGKQTAAYKAMLAVANGMSVSQVKAAEFLEDWTACIACKHEEQDIPVPKAIAAVREITIEGLRKIGNTEAQLSASRTTFEEVKASGKEQIPTLIDFTCVPYVGLSSRTFQLRLGIQTGGDKPTLTLRIVKQEEHQEQMGRELANLLLAAIREEAGSSDAVPVLLGTYAAGS